MTLILARVAFGAVAAALAVLTFAAIAERRAVQSRRDWWLTARWARLADAGQVAGRVLLYCAGVLIGLAAFLPGGW